MKHFRFKRQSGFSLIELVFTLAIMALLATIVVPLVKLDQQRSKEEDLRLALRELRTAIDHYKRLSDEGRITRKFDETGYPPDLSVLVEGVSDQRDPAGRKIYLLRRLPLDPMNANAEKEQHAGWGLRSYASEPDHPQAGADVYDIYSQSTAVGLNGIPYQKW